MKNLVTVLALIFFCNSLDAQTTDNKFDPGSWFIIDVYLDADMDEQTGMRNNWLYTSSGIDYMAQGPFIYKYTGAPGVDEWKWSDLSSVERKCSSDSSFVEGLINKKSITDPPLSEKFGISFPYYLKNATSAHIIYFPQNNDAYQQKKLFKYKSRPKNDLNSTIELLSGNAYYYSFMIDPDVAQCLNFAATGTKEDKSMQWASWVLKINSPASYDVTFTIQNSEPAVLELSLIDMSTNLVVKTFPEIIINQVNSQFANVETGKINLSDIPAGNYMFKLKDRSDFTNDVKIEKISLAHVLAGRTDFPNEKYSIRSHSGFISVKGSNHFDVYLYSLDGKKSAVSLNNNEHYIHQDKGVYLLQIIEQHETFVRKLIVL